MNEDLYRELILVAQSRRLTTYSDVARIVNLDMEIDAQRDQMTELLTEITNHEEQVGRPMLTAVVVHRGNDNNPGEGFFTTAAESGRFEGGHDQIRRLEFWVSEVSAVHDYWKQ